MYCIGFDIGGTKCAVSLGNYFDNKIEILERFETPTKNDPQATFDELSAHVKKWIRQFHVKKSGISCGGPLDSEKGIIISPPNLSPAWHGFEIVSYISSKFGIDAKLENDANASAVAEWNSTFLSIP